MPTPAGSAGALPPRTIGATVRPPNAQPAGGVDVMPTGLQRFRFGTELGRGGMGSVRLAVDESLRRELAIKTLHHHDDEAVTGFIEEAQITGQLAHPNIIPVYELGTDPMGLPWLAMKRVVGHSLREALERRSRTEPIDATEVAWIVDVLRKIGDAMAYAHSRGVIHRDLKPDNVMLGDFGEVLVMDWGLARPLDGDDRRRTGAISSSRRDDGLMATLQGDVLGTPAYMPPEQARGDTVDVRADVFALGAILYQMLTLSAPYGGRTTGDVLAKALRRDLKPARHRSPKRNIPRDLEAIADKAMAERPADRYRDVAEMMADVDAFRAFRPVSARRAGPIERGVRWARRRPASAIAASMTVLFSLVIGLVMSDSARRAEAAARRAEAAELEVARADAERERVARQQEAAVAAQREAEVRALAQAGQLEELQVRLGVELRAAGDDVRQEFRARWRRAGSDMFDRLPPAEARRFEQAFQSLIEANAKYGDRVPIEATDYLLLGMLRANLHDDLAGAEDLYRKAIELDPDMAVAHFNLGELCRRRKDFDAGIRAMTRAIEIDPGFLEARVRLATMTCDNGDVDGAIAILDELLARRPRHASGWFHRANILVAGKRRAEAIESYTRAIDADPGYLSAWQNRRVIRLQLGQRREAFEDLLALERYPKAPPSMYVERARMRGSRNDAAALQDLDKAQGLGVDTADLYFQRAQIHRKHDRKQKALADFSAAIERDPELMDAYILRASLKDTPGAIEDYDRAIAVDETYWPAWVNRGVLLGQSGRIDEARASFDRALEVAPADRQEQITNLRRKYTGD